MMLIWFGKARRGKARRDVAWLKWSGAARRGLVWSRRAGLMRHVAARPGASRSGMAGLILSGARGTTWHGVVCRGQADLVRRGEAWRASEWHGAADEVWRGGPSLRMAAFGRERHVEARLIRFVAARHGAFRSGMARHGGARPMRDVTAWPVSVRRGSSGVADRARHGMAWPVPDRCGEACLIWSAKLRPGTARPGGPRRGVFRQGGADKARQGQVQRGMSGFGQSWQGMADQARPVMARPVEVWRGEDGVARRGLFRPMWTVGHGPEGTGAARFGAARLGVADLVRLVLAGWCLAWFGTAGCHGAR